MKYVAMWNMPGCLPEMEPAEFDSFDEAKRFIIDEIKSAEDGAESEEDAETFCTEAEDVNLESGPFCTSVMPDGYVYSVEELDEKEDDGRKMDDEFQRVKDAEALPPYWDDPL